MDRAYYNVLGISLDSTPEEVREAYFALVKRLHPDVNPDPRAREQFFEIQEAYEVLSDAWKRSDYDLNLTPKQKKVNAVTVKVVYSRNTVPLISDPQLLYALVDIKSMEPPDISLLPPVHLNLVIDRSTSMRGDRMDMVKANFIQMIHKMKPNDLLSVVAFSDRAEMIVPPTRIANIDRIESRISMLQEGGATEIYRGLSMGFNLLKHTPDPKALRQLILLTDGHTYGDEEACFSLAEQAIGSGISIDALGLGHEWNDVFLDKLTGMSGGRALLVNSSSDLANYLEKKLVSIGVVFAKCVTLNMQPAERVQIRYAFRLYPDQAKLNISNEIPLGNLEYGKDIRLLLEFYLEPIQAGEQKLNLANAKIFMDVPSQFINRNRYNLDMLRPVFGRMEREQPPAPIVEALSRLTLYRMQEKAREEVASGDFNSATKHLHHLATHLLSKGDRDLAHTVLMESDYIQKNRMYSQSGDKRIKYGTRSLMMLPEPERNNEP